MRMINSKLLHGESAVIYGYQFTSEPTLVTHLTGLIYYL